MGRFDGSVAVVTGAGGGLGRASAERLAAEGASVVVIDVNGDTAEQVAAAIGNKSIAVQADISSETDVQRYIDAALAAFGHIDHHHLNAGIFGTFDPLPDISVEDFQRVMDVNVRGQFLGLRAAFRQYAQQSNNGAIVLTASIASITGIVPTDLFAAAATTPGGANDMAKRASTTPLRRAGRAEEIAAVAAFLLSEDASYMTGQIVSADGGANIVNTVRPSGGAGAWDYEAVDRNLYHHLKEGADR
jgi:NAD(P)-dependent dehydrogenase (short-subunit alcohol dehydrogenase family)